MGSNPTGGSIKESMFWTKGPRLDDYRIAEVFVPESNASVFKVEKYIDCGWVTKQTSATIENAVEWVKRYRKADNVKYYLVE